MPTPAQLKAMKKLQDDRKGKKKGKKKPAPRTPEQEAKIKEFNDKYFKRNEPKEPGKMYKFGNSPSQRKRLSTTGSSDVAAKRKERAAKRAERIAERKATKTKTRTGGTAATSKTGPRPPQPKPTKTKTRTGGTATTSTTGPRPPQPKPTKTKTKTGGTRRCDYPKRNGGGKSIKGTGNIIRCGGRGKRTSKK